MKRRLQSRFLACLLSMAMVAASLPGDFPAKVPAVSTDSDAWKGYEPTEQSVSISAESKDSITVIQREEIVEEIDGILEIEGREFQIERDYEQTCMLQVTNHSDQISEFYLEVKNKFDDISLEIVKSGSKDSPAILKPGETAEVELSVFAQNAKQENYKLAVEGYLFKNGSYALETRVPAVLNLGLPELNLTWKRISEDASTLAQRFSVKNEGDALTDLEIAASDSISDYVYFRPAVSNYELLYGKEVFFTVCPDLAKMKEEGIQALNGSLTASCAGKTSAYDCTFDTKGQEITVTSMGELALKQNGNPFSKFEVEEEGSSFWYFDGTQYKEAEKAADFFDENGEIHLKGNVKLDLGAEEPLDASMTVQTSVCEEGALEEGFSSSAKWLENGALRVSLRTAVTGEAYRDYIKGLADAASADPKFAQIFCFASERDSVEDAERKMLEVTLDINDIASYFDMEMDEISVLGTIYDICTVGEEIGGAIEVFADPTMSDENKRYYLAATAGKMVLMGTKYLLDYMIPGSGFIFDLLTRGIQKDLDELQEKLRREKLDPAIYQEIMGRQCTNRGRITSSFYVPDYGKDGNQKKTSMHTSSRLYADGYVNGTKTNYEILLNDVPAQSVNVPGLTETVITEIPSDGLKPGQVNTLEFIYDTSPGSHYVSTDTKVTFSYPKDTQIGYIGEPESLQEVRPLPDFAVYPENIFSAAELIEGEETELSFHAYNLGSRGGWFTVAVSDGEREIFRKEHYYLEAFSEETFLFPYTPDSGSHTITVTLTNTSVGVSELDDENNTASVNLTARRRQVPEIRDMTCGELYEETPFSLLFDVGNYADAGDIGIWIDGEECYPSVRISGTGNIRRYQAVMEQGLKAGEHRVKFSVKYDVALGTKTVTKEFPIAVSEQKVIVPCAFDYPEGTLLYGEKFEFGVTDAENLTRVELVLDHRQIISVKQYGQEENNCRYFATADLFGTGDHVVTIRMYYAGRDGEILYEDCSAEITVAPEEDSYFSFTLDETMEEPSFSLFCVREESCFDLSCKEIGSNAYHFMKTLDMLENPEDYKLLVRYRGGLCVQDISENNVLIHTKDNRRIRLEQNSFYADIAQIRMIGLKENSIDFELPLFEEFSISPGIYLLQISGNAGEEYFNRTIEVDVSQTDQTIRPDEFIFSRRFKMEGSDSVNWSAGLYFKESGWDIWECSPMSTIFNENTGILDCYMAESFDKSDLEEMAVVVYSESELYVSGVTLSEFQKNAARESMPDNYITLNRDSLQKVTFRCDMEGMKVSSVEAGTEMFQVDLKHHTFYLPDGQYEFKVTVSAGSQNVSVTLEDDVRQETEFILDKKLNGLLDKITVRWSEKYSQQAAVYSRLASGKEISAYGFSSGGYLLTEPEEQFLYAALEQEDYHYIIEKELSGDGLEDEINVGSSFLGRIEGSFGGGYLTEEEIAFSLSGLQDNSGNRLAGFYGEGKSFKGKLTFTDITDEKRQFIVPAEALSEAFVTAVLPKESGTYRMSLVLYSYAACDVHRHVLVVDAAKQAGCTEDGLTEGCHCGICGEIIEKQSVVLALGHNWSKTGDAKKATVLKEGEETYVCTRCGAQKSNATAKIPPPQKGQILTDTVSNAKYKITRAGAKNGTAAYLRPIAKKKTVKIPSVIKKDGIVYRVTSIASRAFKGNRRVISVTVGENVTEIGAGAFWGCRKLKKIVIRSKKLKKIGANCIRNIHRKAVIKAPKGKVRKYKKLLSAKKGYQKSMTIKAG